MKNFIESGTRMPVEATAAIASGDVVVVEDLIGVAEGSAAAGEVAILVLTGVFELSKAQGAALAQGKKVYWDGTAKQVTATAAGNKELGRVFTSAAADDSKIAVRLAY